MIKPMIELIIPRTRTDCKEKLPDTVGRNWVRFILLSKSTSYQLFRMSAPAITSVPPMVIYKNLSHNSKKDVSVKYKASQNPLKIGRIFAINTNPLTNNFISVKNPRTLCLSISYSVVINFLHLFK